MGPRFFLRTDLYYSRVLYEVQPLDNSRAGAQLSFVRQINPNRSLSLNLRGERTEFDEDALWLEFSLDKGSFATTVLRELVDY